MCGRFTLSKPVKVIADLFELAEPPEILAPRYNIAPGQPISVIALKQGGVRRGMAMLKWGLLPSWADMPQSGPRPINARTDSLHKPTFREAFLQRRCLIPADGFYEWRKVGKVKQPVHFRMTDGAPFVGRVDGRDVQAGHVLPHHDRRERVSRPVPRPNAGDSAT